MTTYPNDSIAQFLKQRLRLLQVLGVKPFGEPGVIKPTQELDAGRKQRYDCTVDILTRIKRLAIARRLRFTFKADTERIRDGLSVEDIVESLVNAPVINKTLRSRSPHRLLPREQLHVIISSTYDGTLIYTKGTIRRTQGIEEYYLLISAKKDTV